MFARRSVFSETDAAVRTSPTTEPVLHRPATGTTASRAAIISPACAAFNHVVAAVLPGTVN